MEKSPDAFRTISEVADHLETPAHVLRFWESRFPQIKPVKRAGGRRYYRPSDVALLAGIKRLLHDEGMTIRGVQKMLREQGVRQVAAFGSDTAALEEVFAVDERLLEGIPGVGPEPPSAEILAFAARPKPDEGPAVTDPNLREGEEAAAGAAVGAPKPVLPPLPVTALEVQGDEVATLPPALGPLPPVEVLAEEVEEAPFLDTEAEPDWQEAGTAELHVLHGGEDEGMFVGSGDWEPEDEAEAEQGFEPAAEVPPPEESAEDSAEDIADLAALDGVDLLVAGLLDAAGETVAVQDDNVFGAPGALEAWAEEGRAEEGWDEAPVPEPVAEPVPEPVVEAAPEPPPEPQPVPAPRQGDLWSAAGLAAPPPVAPPPRGAELLLDGTDDLLDVDLASVLPALTRLRAAAPEALAGQAAELAALRDRLLDLRESMASAARVRAR